MEYPTLSEKADTRRFALDHAIRFHSAVSANLPSTPTQVVETAKAFETFLSRSEEPEA